jgi:hypothetical protein
VKLTNFAEYFSLLRAVKITTFGSKMVIFTARNTKIIFENFTAMHRAIFSVFYNISQPNFAILVILI